MTLTHVDACVSYQSDYAEVVDSGPRRPLNSKAELFPSGLVPCWLWTRPLSCDSTRTLLSFYRSVEETIWGCRAWFFWHNESWEQMHAQKQQLCLRGESVLLSFCSKRLTIKHFVMKNTFLKLRSWIDYCNSCRKNFTLPRIDPSSYDTTGQTTEPPKYAKTSIQV